MSGDAPEGQGTAAERVLWRGRASYRSQAALFLTGAVLVAVGVAMLPPAAATGMPGAADIASTIAALGVVAIVIAFLTVMATEYTVTDRGVRARRGIVARTVVEIRGEWITGTRVSQDVLGRLLGYGDVAIATAGGTGAVLAGVADPARVAAAVEVIARAAPL
ncbi:MAG: PH domain-containing protein [Candidatus Nanopusillus sp.]